MDSNLPAITIADAKTLFALWGEHKTHQPRREYELHEVTYNDRNNNPVTIVCEDYIITDKLATFSNIRTRISFTSDAPIARAVRFYDEWDYNEKTSDVYRMSGVYVKSASDFSVAGYTITRDKTINADRIISIDSLLTVDSTEWYSIVEEQATKASYDKIIAYNIKIVDHNKECMSEEYIKRLISHLELINMVRENNWNENDWERKLRKSKWGPFAKFFYPRPTELTVPNPLTKEFCDEYLDHITKNKYSSVDEMDMTYLYKYMCPGTTPKNAAEEVEYTHI